MVKYKLIAELTERELIEEVHAKNPAAFTSFYTRNFSYLVLLSEKYVKDLAIAEEIVQDVFLRLWESPVELDKPGSLKAYLGRSVINNSINYIRRQKNIQQHHTAIAGEITEKYILEQQEEQELRVLIYKEIEALPAQCRKVFKMSRFDGLKYREISEILNISEKTVENHIVNALKILKSKLFSANSQIKGSYVLKMKVLLLFYV